MSFFGNHNQNVHHEPPHGSEKSEDSPGNICVARASALSALVVLF
jgi:hypothetical protein